MGTVSASLLSALVLAACGVPAEAPAPRVEPAPASWVTAEAKTLEAPIASAFAPSPPHEPDPADEATAVLPIADVHQDENAPDDGWCGETAIQEGLLYYGMFVPQAGINAAGKPRHPDLYSYDIPVALGALGARFAWFQPKHGDGFPAFARWIKDAIDAKRPVLAGVKILPTKHPEWGLDHFVLVVGYGPRGLLVNTTWGRREWVADTSTPGLSFKGAAYAIRLDGVTPPSKGGG